MISIQDLIYLYLVSQGRIPPLKFINHGQFISKLKKDGFLGGELSGILSDGNVAQAVNLVVNKFVSCGHLIHDIREVSGVCFLCGGVACEREGCFEFCEIENIPVCRLHYKRIDGVVVSDLARKRALWKWEVKRIQKAKERLLKDDQKLLSE